MNKSEQDKRIAREWAAWLPEGKFHFDTKDAPYVDHNRCSRSQLKSLTARSPQPSIFKTVAGAVQVPLPRRKTFPDSEFIRVLMARRTHREFSKEDVTLQTVSEILALVWGVTGYLHTPIYGKLLLKTSPSAGARHPGEVYLMALRVRGLKSGIYHYHPARHRLERVTAKASRIKAWHYCVRMDFVKEAAALFLMTAVFPRTMWKYQHPRAYRVVLLDAGHLCQTFCLVSTWLGLAPFCTAAFKDTLIEKELEIDGIRESMLYVAGVGVPVDSKSPANKKGVVK